MAPSPTTQQDLDFLERIGKMVAALAIIGGAAAGLVRWIRRRREARETRYAIRIETVVRAAFASELTSMNGACTQLARIESIAVDNTKGIGDMQRETIRAMQAGDELLDELLALLRISFEWLDDLQTFTDHTHNIDRRSSIGQERRIRFDERFDAIQERRQRRRRATDVLRDQLDVTREREREIMTHDEENPNETA